MRKFSPYLGISIYARVGWLQEADKCEIEFISRKELVWGQATEGCTWGEKTK